MKVINKSMSLEDFEAWQGAKNTKQLILDNNRGTHFEHMIEDMYPDGLTDTQLNDILWFEEDWICKTLRIDNE